MLRSPRPHPSPVRIKTKQSSPESKNTIYHIGRRQLTAIAPRSPMEAEGGQMHYPQYDGISCEHCGLVSPGKLRSCEHRPGGACPYVLEERATWRSRAWKAEDTIAPTFAELIKTFQDNDGDFSAYQIRKMLLADGASRKLFINTSEGLLGRFLPKIEPTPEAADRVREAQRVIEDAARQFLGEQRGLGNDLFLALRRTVFKKSDKTADPVQEQNAALRKKLLFYVIGVSFALALALCCIASV